MNRNLYSRRETKSLEQTNKYSRTDKLTNKLTKIREEKTKARTNERKHTNNLNKTNNQKEKKTESNKTKYQQTQTHTNKHSHTQTFTHIRTHIRTLSRSAPVIYDRARHSSGGTKTRLLAPASSHSRSHRVTSGVIRRRLAGAFLRSGRQGNLERGRKSGSEGESAREGARVRGSLAPVLRHISRVLFIFLLSCVLYLILCVFRFISSCVCISFFII